MSDKLYKYVLLRNGKLICTKYKTYEYKPVFREDRPYTDYAFITFDKKSSFQATQVLDTSDNFFDFLRNGDSVITTCWVSIINPMVNEKNKHIEIVDRYVEKEISNGIR